MSSHVCPACDDTGCDICSGLDNQTSLTSNNDSTSNNSSTALSITNNQIKQEKKMNTKQLTELVNVLVTRIESLETLTATMAEVITKQDIKLSYLNKQVKKAKTVKVVKTTAQFNKSELCPLCNGALGKHGYLPKRVEGKNIPCPNGDYCETCKGLNGLHKQVKDGTTKKMVVCPNSIIV